MNSLTSLVFLLIVVAAPAPLVAAPARTDAARAKPVCEKAAVPVKRHVLTLRVEGVRSSNGQLRAELLGRPTSDAKPATIGHAVEDARQGVTVLTFRDLAPGDYAVQLFHDENANGKVELSLNGIPTEGFAFSNTPQVHGGIPPFEKMMVTVGGDVSSTAVMVYVP